MSFVHSNLGFCELPVRIVYFYPVQLPVFSFFFFIKMRVLFGLLSRHRKFASDFVDVDFSHIQCTISHVLSSVYIDLYGFFIFDLLKKDLLCH